MNKIERPTSIDYSYFLSIAGVGVLFSCAVFMFGIAFNHPNYGYYGAGLALVITGLFLINIIGRTKNNHTTFMSEAKYISSENKGVAMLTTSPAGDVVYANGAAKTLFKKYNFGEPKSPVKIEISNRNSLKNFLDTIAVGEMKVIVSEIRESGKYLKLEVEKIYKDGDFFSWRIFEEANPETSFDVENWNPESLSNLGRVFEKSEIGFFAINKSSQIISMNSVFSHALFKRGNIPDYPFDLSIVSQHSSRNLKGKVEFMTDKGVVTDALVSRWNIGENNEIGCFMVVMDEKTNEALPKRTSEASEENSFFWNSPTGIAVVDQKGMFRECNIVFRNFIADLELEEQSRLSDILTEENAAEVFREINKTIETGKPSKLIELSFKGDGEKRGQFYVTKAINEDKNEVIVYLIDITEQKNLELQFSQSQKMQAVGQLAGGVAHDFNNLLTAITGFCDLLLVKHGPGDQSFSDIIQIKQNANRAANLVRQLLAFSRQQTLRPKIIIMTDVVAELSNLLRRLIGSNIELEMNHGRNIDPVRVDQGQLEQVIINLCVNARDAMPDGGKLEIKTRNIGIEDSMKVNERHQVFPKGEYVLLEVKDNGTGIAKDHLDKVFEPFFSTKEVGKGTGLGLSTVYGIIKQTNGFVFPESEVGVGTSFKIYLPKYEASDEDDVEVVDDVAKVDEQPQDLTGSSTILLVEDEDAVRMFASRALKNKGYTVFEADCGTSALKLLAETDSKIDLLISDVMMPQMDGPTLVKKIRETDKSLKVIFISGYAEDALDDNIMDKDFNFLSKPFTLKQLAEQVKEVLEN